MANIGSASVRIVPNMTGIQGKIAAGFKGAAGPATKKLGDEVDSSSGHFQGAINKLGGIAKVGGLAIAGGLAAGVAGLATLTGKAVMAQAELEQQLGGSEAVFGEFAKTLQETAKNAYASAGLSQQEFLQGANKMGSLFQGAGFSVKESLDMSSESMQRASDIASIMGISTVDALAAVTGMAKGNFTMMDNLGVAMNDTAIGAFALSKGINKSTEQMSIQEKVGLAQQMFMEKTAKYAGNYAKENAILSGSLNTTTKAFNNLLAGQGDIDSFIDSLLNTIGIAVPQITAMLPKIVQGIGQTLKALVPALSSALPTLIPALIGAVVELLNALVAALPSVMKALLAAMPTVIDAFIKLFLAIVQALPAIIQNIATALPTIINAIVTGLTTPVALQAIIMGAVQLLLALIQAIPIIIPALIAAIPLIIKNIYAVLTSPQFIEQMINAGVQLLKATIKGMVSMQMAVARAAWDIIKVIASNLSPDKLIGIGKGVVRGLWGGIQDMGGWLKTKVINFIKDKIPGPVREALGIASPSKVAAMLGRQVPAGLAQGIYQGGKEVERAATKIADSALSGMAGMNMNANLSTAMNTTGVNSSQVGQQSVAPKSIVQNNNIYNQVDLDSVTRELAWQIRR